MQSLTSRGNAGVLRIMHENAHHLVWLVIQFVLIILGVALTIFSK